MAVIVGAKMTSVNTPLFTIGEVYSAVIYSPLAGKLIRRMAFRSTEIAGEMRILFGSAVSCVANRVGTFFHTEGV
jgi:hypothetical protein